MKASIEVDIVDDSMTASIEAALIEALNKRSDVLVKTIVSDALNADTSTGYGKKASTGGFIKNALKKAIQAAAINAVQKLVEGKQIEIQLAVEEEVAKVLTTEFITERVMDGLKGMTAHLALAITEKKPRADDLYEED